MIITQLTTEGRLALSLSFHPRVTVVTGLGSQRRVLVADMIAAAFKGDPTGVRIDAEVEGQILELTSDIVAELDLDESGPDVRILGRDLPGAEIVEPSVIEAAAEDGE